LHIAKEREREREKERERKKKKGKMGEREKERERNCAALFTYVTNCKYSKVMEYFHGVSWS